MGQTTLPFAPTRKVWQVSELLAGVNAVLDREYFSVWLEGEISNFHQAPSRHCYFTLKDARGQIRAAMFAQQARLLRFRPRDGLHVLARGRISIYEARGELQCYVEHLEPLGEGSLQLAFEQLKQKLAAEGLFAAERKRPLPVLPRRIGLITSPRGAAVADMIHILHRRFPKLEILLYPVAVQGEAAAGEIARALDYFSAQAPGDAAHTDLLIVGRGGGSLEDLWAFNEEVVARALARATIPTISAVGHETDFTIADFVADLRAPTPSAAAELAVQPLAQWMAQIEGCARRLEQAARFRVLHHRHRLEKLVRHGAFRAVRHRLGQRGMATDELAHRLERALRRDLDRRQRRLVAAAARLRHHDARGLIATAREHLGGLENRLRQDWQRLEVERRHHLERLTALLGERNPLAVLQRGYALVYDATGKLVMGPEAVADRERLRIRMAGGWLEAEARKD